jgi:hypothetical protein
VPSEVLTSPQVVTPPTSQIPLLTMFGRNGAYDGTTLPGFPIASPNTRNDLNWEIQSASNTQGVINLETNPLFELDVIPDATAYVQQCILKNALNDPSTIRADQYTIEIKLTDGGGDSRVLTVEVNYGISPNPPNESRYTLGGIQRQFVEVQFTNTGAATDGYYVYTAPWSFLTGNLISNTITIQGAILTFDSCPIPATEPRWYKASTLSAVRNKVAQCYAGVISYEVDNTQQQDDTGLNWEVIP